MNSRSRAQRFIADAVAPTIAEQLVDHLGITEHQADRASHAAVEALQRDGWIIAALPLCRCATGHLCRPERHTARQTSQESREALSAFPGPAGSPR